MTEEQKPKPEKQIEELELNKETVQDLTEEQAEKAEGGLVRDPGAGAALSYPWKCA